MPEVQTFLREAWDATEHAHAAIRAEKLRQKNARQAEWLRQENARNAAAVKAKRESFYSELLSVLSGVSIVAYFIGSVGGCFSRMGDGASNGFKDGLLYPFEAFVSVGLFWVVCADAICAVIAFVFYYPNDPPAASDAGGQYPPDSEPESQ